MRLNSELNVEKVINDLQELKDKGFDSAEGQAYLEMLKTNLDFSTAVKSSSELLSMATETSILSLPQACEALSMTSEALLKNSEASKPSSDTGPISKEELVEFVRLNKSFDAIVIGGGIVGMSNAYHYKKLGGDTKSVLIIDIENPGRASNAGAGILSPETVTNLAHPDENRKWYNFAEKANAYYPELIAALEKFHPTGYGVSGYMKIATVASAEEITRFDQATVTIMERQKGNADFSPDRFFELENNAAIPCGKSYPEMALLDRGIYNANGGRIDGRLLNRALKVAAEDLGVKVLRANVDELIFEDNKVTGVKIGDQEIKSTAISISGGAWSEAFADQLKVKFPVWGQRGEIIHFHLPPEFREENPDTGSWPVISSVTTHYVVPWPDGHIVAGATRENAASLDNHITLQGVLEVLNEAVRNAPILNKAYLKEIRVGIRPKTEDDLPVLGRIEGIEGVFLNTGHGGGGLMIGPYSGKVIAEQMLSDRELSADIKDFNISRFKE